MATTSGRSRRGAEKATCSFLNRSDNALSGRTMQPPVGAIDAKHSDGCLPLLSWPRRTPINLSSDLPRRRLTAPGGTWLPGLTYERARGLRLDASFHAAFQGKVYAQPLLWRRPGSSEGELIVATEDNEVFALDAQSGAQIWKRALGSPGSRSAFLARVSARAEVPAGARDRCNRWRRSTPMQRHLRQWTRQKFSRFP